MRKSVRWSTITVYEFGVGIGGSAVPKRGEPSVGLAKKPEFVWNTTVVWNCASESDEENNLENGVARKVNGVRSPRHRRVRWLKPLERVTMLTKAGYSEKKINRMMMESSKKIYRMMMESSHIAMSRRLSIAVDKTCPVSSLS